MGESGRGLRSRLRGVLWSPGRVQAGRQEAAGDGLPSSELLASLGEDDKAGERAWAAVR